MERVAITLGLITLILALLAFSSSRSFASLFRHAGMNLLDNRIYKGYYRYHAIFWSIFAFMLFIHISMGSIHIVLNSFTNDPDAYLHRYVLAAGLTGLLLVGAIVTSCRSLLGFLSILYLKNPLSIAQFQRYYKLHSYFWLMFLVPIIIHYWFSYLHAGGFWPH